MHAHKCYLIQAHPKRQGLCTLSIGGQATWLVLFNVLVADHYCELGPIVKRSFSAHHSGIFIRFGSHNQAKQT